MAENRPASSIMRAVARRLAAARSGATAIEYCVMAALFGVAVFAGGGVIRDTLSNVWASDLLPRLVSAYSGESGDGGDGRGEGE